jgi:hypothetical protein
VTDIDPHNPLTQQAMKRLRALAHGNGMEPASITLMHGDEQTHIVEGVVTLEPLVEIVPKIFPGKVRVKDQVRVESIAALRADAAKRKKEFSEQPNWIEEAKKELHVEAPGQGWGLDNAKVILPARAVVLTATDTCTHCQGAKQISCTQCRGQGHEICWQCRGQRQEVCCNCNGSGQNPYQQGQQCTICQGMRYIQCRLCTGTGQTVCQTCTGKRGTPCPTCKGHGSMTEEAHMAFGATTRFTFKGNALPSGLRRGLDRLGISNLIKGHADIKNFEPPIEDEDVVDDKKPADKPPSPMLHYRAHIPFADLRVNFGGQKAAIGSFGKRGVLLDVPNFLDDVLDAARQSLSAAAQGQNTLSDALKTRAIKNAFTLELEGKGTVREFRRFYPIGISAAVADDILRTTQKTLKRMTQTIRAIAAIGCFGFSALVFGALYFSHLTRSLGNQPHGATMALDIVPPVVLALLSWLLLNRVTRYVVQREFPDTKIVRRATTGKIGVAMIVGIFVIWVVLLMLSPAHPYWMPQLLR